MYTHELLDASKAKLTYISDTSEGIRRVKFKHGFTYKDISGKTVKDRQILKRIRQLVIPPAWDSVWISPDSKSHIQATGYDEKGRKQYKYHEQWIQLSQQHKFDHLLTFTNTLPVMRERIEADMQTRGLKERQVLATIVWLLEHTYIRIGNKEYASENKHYGLTTLRNKHVTIKSNDLVFSFIGKSGKDHTVHVTHPKIIRIIRKLEELPGYNLFQYIDEEGSIHSVYSEQVNTYLKEITGEDITAKDFRTWGGTIIAAQTLYDLGMYTSQTQAKKNITQAVKEVALNLGNTTTVSRKYYIHPKVTQAYTQNTLIPHLQKYIDKEVETLYLSSYEKALIKLISA